MLVVTRRRSFGKFNLAMHSPEDSQHDRKCGSARLQRPGPEGSFQYRTADQAQRPGEIRGALRSLPDSDMHPRPHGRVEKIFAPCTGTGALATGELADHQPHVDDYIACAQLKPAA
jgi:hypothetical protein